ncbi:MAG: hypothetical protein JSV19_03495, partial [Phycisphaerales bacterium]
MSCDLYSHKYRIVIAVLAALLGTAPLSAQSVIVDNTDPGFTVLSETWGTATADGQWGTDYRYKSTKDSPPGEVEWRPTIPTADAYEVAVWYPPVDKRPNDAHYTVHHDSGVADVYVNQQINDSQWVVLGTYDFATGTSGYVTLTSDAQWNKNVIADAVRFRTLGPVDLTMAVSPPGTGTTDPPEGGPYPKTLDEVVSIQAFAALGYRFDRWEVSAGSPPADPNAASTTVTMDQTKTVTAVFVEQGIAPPEFRAFWADAFHAGYKSTDQIDTMISMAVAGNYNAVIPEVLAYQDNVGSGHGAYWNSSIIPKAADIVGDIDPLAYLVEQAHAA